MSVLHEDDDRDMMSLDDFLGKKLGVLANTGVEEQARGALGKSVQAFDRIEDALRALAEKKLDAVLEENLIAEYFIDKAGLPLKVGVPFAAPIRVGLAVPKGNKDIEQRLSLGVQNLVKDQSFKLISTRWFGYLDKFAPEIAKGRDRFHWQPVAGDARKRYIVHSLKREYASDNGTELNAMLPKMSPLNPLYLTKKQTVFQKVAAFVEKFKGVGGAIG